MHDKGHYRVRKRELVLKDILTIRDKHKANCFMFGEDCFPPPILAALSNDLSDVTPPLSWQREVRFDKAFSAELIHRLARAGCRNLVFGLESYSSRLLSAMNKGTSHVGIDRILEYCRRSLIAFNLQLFFGFPSSSSPQRLLISVIMRLAVVDELKDQVRRRVAAERLDWKAERATFISDKVSQRTRVAYDRALGLLEAWLTTHKLTPSNLTPRDANDFIRELRGRQGREGKPPDADAVRLVVSVCSSFFTFLERRDATI